MTGWLDHLESPAGGALLDQRGWPSSDTKNAVDTLIEAQPKFGYWGHVAARQATRIDQLTDSEMDEESGEEAAAAEQDD